MMAVRGTWRMLLPPLMGYVVTTRENDLPPLAEVVADVPPNIFIRKDPRQNHPADLR
jgi:hypothetical protein